MKSIILLLTSIFVTHFVSSQSEKTDSIYGSNISDIFIPVECLGGTLYVEKLEELTSGEISSLVSQVSYDFHYESNRKRVKNSIIEGSEFFNTYYRHKLNQYIDEELDKHSKMDLVPVYSSDLVPDQRYSIRVKFNYEEFDEFDQEVEFYIHDNREELSFKPVKSLELLLKLIKSGESYMRESANRTQEDFNLHCEKKNEKKVKKTFDESSNTGPIIVGVITVVVLVLGGVLGSIL